MPFLLFSTLSSSFIRLIIALACEFEPYFFFFFCGFHFISPILLISYLKSNSTQSLISLILLFLMTHSHSLPIRGLNYLSREKILESVALISYPKVVKINPFLLERGTANTLLAFLEE